LHQAGLFDVLGAGRLLGLLPERPTPLAPNLRKSPLARTQPGAQGAIGRIISEILQEVEAMLRTRYRQLDESRPSRPAAQRHSDGRICTVGVRLGQYAGVDPDSLRFCFESLVKNTPLDPLSLDITLCAGDELVIAYLEVDRP
jgi:hypothetical protein